MAGSFSSRRNVGFLFGHSGIATAMSMA